MPKTLQPSRIASVDTPPRATPSTPKQGVKKRRPLRRPRRTPQMVPNRESALDIIIREHPDPFIVAVSMG